MVTLRQPTSNVHMYLHTSTGKRPNFDQKTPGEPASRRAAAPNNQPDEERAALNKKRWGKSYAATHVNTRD